MDVVIRASDTLKVVTHNQYNTLDHIAPDNVPESPFELFGSWLTGVQGIVPEAEAMSLSTATASGIPSSRFVLLKQLDKRGFVFYTNYTSRKSKELLENPHAALAWWWKEVHMQVRAVGRVEKVTKEESEEYFKSRPLGSRLGAWASRQSSVVGEDELASRLNEMQAWFGVDSTTEDADVPLPEFWGGWRVIPDEIEFWAGKPSRLHDRIQYTRIPGSSDDSPQWKIERLAP